MQVQQINYQHKSPNFGTKVIVEKDTRKLINQLPKDARQTIDDAIKQLTNNGVNDKLYLSHCYDMLGSEKGQVILRGWTTSIRNGEKYKTPVNYDGRDFLSDKIFNWNTTPKSRIANIMNIYKEAKACEVLEGKI